MIMPSSAKDDITKSDCVFCTRFLGDETRFNRIQTNTNKPIQTKTKIKRCCSLCIPPSSQHIITPKVIKMSVHSQAVFEEAKINVFFYPSKEYFKNTAPSNRPSMLKPPSSKMSIPSAAWRQHQYESPALKQHCGERLSKSKWFSSCWEWGGSVTSSSSVFSLPYLPSQTPDINSL